MPKDYPRALRVADQIQRELADLLRHEIKDPRINQMTITAVEVSRDFAIAKVFYTSLGGQERIASVEEGLKKAKGFLRSSLSKRLQLRVAPELIFRYDESIEYGSYLSKLIDEAVSQENENNT